MQLAIGPIEILVIFKGALKLWRHIRDVGTYFVSLNNGDQYTVNLNCVALIKHTSKHKSKHINTHVYNLNTWAINLYRPMCLESKYFDVFIPWRYVFTLVFMCLL